ncbi:hypothetical protein [Dysgonomonas sp. BGC7]|uniref:hypothetical protein n=1 Tax=Dysgonomonas sp. BGC7 TaxID=1658008 RepID=UPI0006836DDA|nr:hypothetical protein [Dysgonomonas sp. BGC7]MBD8390375.1 hypothetical protein [Dysgonomonas sp. BGC7]
MAEQLSRQLNIPIIQTSKTNKKPKEAQITDKSFTKGKILKMAFDKSDGISIKGEYKHRNKYFVVLGEIPNDGIVGTFFINSEINENIINTKDLLDCQFPLKEKDYTQLLKYDSYLDCSELFEINKVKIKNIGVEIGSLTKRDNELVTEHIENSKVLTPKQKKKFGFEDKS